MRLSRRRALGVIGAALASPGLASGKAWAAEFAYKLGTALPPEHPLCIRCTEAAKRIKEESGGALEITLYPNSVLGQDTAMISQTITGALQMFVLSTDLLAPRKASAGIFGVGFAFAGYDQIWAAMDGKLGDFLRAEAEALGFHCLEKCFDHGFREITTRNKPIDRPEDLKGFKMRLPFAPFLIALFQHLGASPTPINGGEIYSALQTGLVDGQENPLILIDAARFYEVEKYCSMTNHVWAGLHISFNTQAWKRLPAAVQDIAARHLTEAALLERDDARRLNQTEMQTLQDKGLIFNTPESGAFRDMLRRNGFYTEMKQKTGAEAWALLESYVGPLG
ncbi:MAG: TRAP transporter substrate-binding protein [Alphaproteobacteria bacterium]|nr:TRAP transporter substrate-binding protein [Alphaproteobacteria bacterium]